MKQPDRKNKGLRISRRTLIRGAIYSTIALTGSVAYAQSDNLEILKIDVPIDNLPPSLDNFSIGVLADFHAGAWGNKKVIYDAISAMQHLKPDIITLLGDYVDGARSHDGHNIENGMYLFHALKSLKAPLGVYAVLGNHDHWTDSVRVTKLLTEKEITVLVDESIVLPNGLILVGVDDYWEGDGNPRKALAGVDKNNPVILLSHNPDINEYLEANDPIQLVLAGHTHGGQVRIPFTGWAPWVPCSKKYRGLTGLFRENDGRWSFISKGVGTFLLPIRLSCPPDIALLRLKVARA